MQAKEWVESLPIVAKILWEENQRNVKVAEAPRYTREQLEADQEAYLKPLNTTGLSRKQRKVYIRDAGICWLCGKHVPIKSASVDHVIPQRDNGPDTLENLKLAHKKCNVYRCNPPKDVDKRVTFLPEVEAYLTKHKDKLEE